jgi:hypothetical protein
VYYIWSFISHWEQQLGKIKPSAIIAPGMGMNAVQLHTSLVISFLLLAVYEPAITNLFRNYFSCSLQNTPEVHIFIPRFLLFAVDDACTSFATSHLGEFECPHQYDVKALVKVSWNSFLTIILLSLTLC